MLGNFYWLYTHRNCSIKYSCSIKMNLQILTICELSHCFHIINGEHFASSCILSIFKTDEFCLGFVGIFSITDRPFNILKFKSAIGLIRDSDWEDSSILRYPTCFIENNMTLVSENSGLTSLTVAHHTDQITHGCCRHK